jgi:hypothetical protein
MTSCSMSSNRAPEKVFRCPVCRATQTLQPECRRCKADLGLSVRARQRLAYLLEQRKLADLEGDGDRGQQIQDELNLLAPQQANR